MDRRSFALSLALFALLALVGHAARAADLTATEMRWLKAGWPVITYAKEEKLPLDISVQPAAQPGDAPLALGFVDGRCKLVLAMRGNPEAEETLARIEPSLLHPVVEAMVAHELGHCWRYVHGAWHTLPAGLADTSVDVAHPDQAFAKLHRDMRETRREEGYADLVGLAWTLSRHPAQYEAVYAWLAMQRDDQPVAGAHHDTRAWLRLAHDRHAFDAAGNPFEQAWPLWRAGLLREN
jgi:hypothetical protein